MPENRQSHLSRINAQVRANKAKMPPTGAAQPVQPGEYPEYKATYQGGPLQKALGTVNPLLMFLPTLMDAVSPTVSKGHTFTAVDGNPAPTLTAAVGDLLHLGAALFGPHETDARIYKKAVLDRRGPITERDFNQAELTQLGRIVSRARQAGRDSIQREDHRDPAARAALEAGTDTWRKYRAANPPSPWNHVIGRANLRDGHVVDSYDFNRYEGWNAAIGNPLELMAPHIWFGRRALPSGLRGVPVDIQLPARGMPRRGDR